MGPEQGAGWLWPSTRGPVGVCWEQRGMRQGWVTLSLNPWAKSLDFDFLSEFLETNMVRARWGSVSCSSDWERVEAGDFGTYKQKWGGRNGSSKDLIKQDAIWGDSLVPANPQDALTTFRYQFYQPHRGILSARAPLFPHNINSILSQPAELLDKQSAEDFELQPRVLRYRTKYCSWRLGLYLVPAGQMNFEITRFHSLS